MKIQLIKTHSREYHFCGEYSFVNQNRCADAAARVCAADDS